MPALKKTTTSIYANMQRGKHHNAIKGEEGRQTLQIIRGALDVGGTLPLNYLIFLHLSRRTTTLARNSFVPQSCLRDSLNKYFIFKLVC